VQSIAQELRNSGVSRPRVLHARSQGEPHRPCGGRQCQQSGQGIPVQLIALDITTADLDHRRCQRNIRIPPAGARLEREAWHFLFFCGHKAVHSDRRVGAHDPNLPSRLNPPYVASPDYLCPPLMHRSCTGDIQNAPCIRSCVDARGRSAGGARVGSVSVSELLESVESFVFSGTAM
jgi:hypothetical protein